MANYLPANPNILNPDDVSKIHEALIYIGISFDTKSYDYQNRIYGEYTQRVVANFQRENGLKYDNEGNFTEITVNLINAKIYNKDIADPKSTIELFQILKKSGFNVSRKVLSGGQIDLPMVETIRAFQSRMFLSVSGYPDSKTKTSIFYFKEREFPEYVAYKPGTKLVKVFKNLDFSSEGQEVRNLHLALSAMGYFIEVPEYQNRYYGKSTIEAVKMLQRSAKIMINGRFNGKTSDELVRLLNEKIPGVVERETTYKLRGTIRDEKYNGIGNCTIEIYRYRFLESPKLIVSKTAFNDGFFDITYRPYINDNGEIDPKNNSLLIRVKIEEKIIGEEIKHNVSPVYYFNYTIGGTKVYLGKNLFRILTGKLLSILDAGNKDPLSWFTDLREDKSEGLTNLSIKIGVEINTLMKLFLSYRISERIRNNFNIIPEIKRISSDIVFALIYAGNTVLPDMILPDEEDVWDIWLDDIESGIISRISLLRTEQTTKILEGAIKNRVIGANFTRLLPIISKEIIPQLGNYVILDAPMDSKESGTLRSLFAISGIEEQKMNTVSERFIINQGFNAMFWNEVKELLPEENYKSLQVNYEYGYLVDYNEHNTNVVTKKLVNSSLDNAYKICVFSQEDWKKTIINEGMEIPKYGEDEKESIDIFAEKLYRKTIQRFPSLSFVSQIKASATLGIPDVRKIRDLLIPRPKFNFIAQNLDPFFREIGAGEELKEQILLVQRIQNYTSEGNVGEVLLNNRFHSAAQIVNHNYDTFASTMRNGGVSLQVSQEIFGQAQLNYTQLFSFFGEFSPFINQTNLGVLGTHPYVASDGAVGIPNLENLFGSLDSCACAECQSVVGASAYLVDIIRFLKTRIAKPSIPGYTETVKDVLIQRRTDLNFIELSCVNTNTAIPYIDIVCEVLENAVSDIYSELDPTHNPQPTPEVEYDLQTHLSEKELRAFPEYINKQAYKFLLNQLYPLHSPVFNLWQENTRLYLAHLGTPWWNFMQIWQNQTSASSPTSVFNYTIAAEYFAFSSLEASVIDNTFLNIPGNSLAQMLRVMWNVDFQNLSPAEYASAEVDWFLKVTGLSYDELLLLLSVDYINVAPPNDRIRIETPLDGDPCSTATQRIINLTLSRYNRIQRFLRLWRHSSWTIWELDILLNNTVVCPPDTNQDPINRSSIINLMQFAEIQKQFKISTEELLSFWGNVNAKNYHASELDIASLYKRLFLNLSFVNPIADDYYNLAYQPSEVAPPANFTSERIKLLSASMAYAEIEVRKILGFYVDPSNGEAEDAIFSLEAIAYVVRHILLFEKININFDDFVIYKTISGIEEPFASVDSLKKSIESLQFIKSIDADFTKWKYILTGNNEDNKNSLKTAILDKFLQELRVSITTAVSDLASIADPSRSDAEKATLLFQRLPQFQNQGQVQRAIDFVEGRSVSIPAEYPDTETTREVFFNDFFSQFIPKSEWQNVLTVEFSQAPNDQPLAPEVLSERYTYLFNYLQSFALQVSYSQLLAQQLGVEQDKMDILLQDIRISDTLDANNSIIAVLFEITDDLVGKQSDGSYIYQLTDSRFNILRKIYLLLHKIVTTIGLLPETTSEDLGQYINYQQLIDSNYPDGDPMLVGITSLSRLPVYAGEEISNLNELLNWIKLEKIRLQYADNTEAFFTIINDAISLSDITNIQFSALFATLTGEQEEIINSIVTQLATQQLQYTDARIWKRLLACLKNYNTIGANVSSLVSWLNKNNSATTGENISNDVVKASKAKYSLDTWLKVVEPFQDTLREKKRDALTAFLIEYSIRTEYPTVPYPTPLPPSTDPVYVNPKYWESNNDLFAYFLLDVDMSPCQLTSRIRQASLSVQVFVQRCFLGLEKLTVEIPNINAEPDALNNWKQWQWMKYYRLWDASRRIFLYPENWIEPELRPDMSPFFKELTEELSQGDVTDEQAEAVLTNYLNKLNEVAQLDIAGVYHEKATGVDTFHVIGKTKANPSNYYYRTLNQITGRWSAWEKIIADITGAHPLITKYNGKVYLFWLLFEEKTDKTKKVPASQLTNAPKDAPEAPKMYEIRLSWIRRNKDGWTEKSVSNEKMIHPWGRPKYSYNLRPRIKSLDNTLWIDLYITTSAEFNKPIQFYNQNTGTFDHIAKAQFDERFRPWHSSSFVFNGAVKELRLRKFYGNFANFVGTNSYEYVNQNFEDAGKAIKLLSSDIQRKINLPWGMHFEYTYLRNNTTHNINTYLFSTLEGNSGRNLLQTAKPTFKMSASLQDSQINYSVVRPFFYQDSLRSFFVRPHFVHQAPVEVDGETWWSIVDRYYYDFNNFYHPYAQVFIQELNKNGIDGLYNRKLQTQPGSTLFYPGNTFDFNSTYSPNTDIVNVMENAQRDIVDFSFDGAYSLYNWELFFHAPFYIANKLSQNQRFEEALKWYEYIFNPTSSDNYSDPQRFWVTKPFFQMTESNYNQSRINYILENISSYTRQVAAWRNDPYNPHLVAEGRPVAYQKAVVMKFIDNLIAWGDYLFRADTMETIHEALTVYILAYQILGKKPEKVPGIEGNPVTLGEIFDPESGVSIDDFGGVSVELENYLINYTGGTTYESAELPLTYTNALPNLLLQYFCIPENPKLLSYWSLVEDRLFKIRHCMNIDGVVRQLPLFEPPIDPALLVRARAQGLSIASVLFSINAPSPNYRFRTVLQKAAEYTAEVKSLGERVLSIIERLDAENLSVLRSTNEINLLDLLAETKELQIQEANQNIANLEKALEITEAKLEYYQGIPKINDEEKISEALSYASTVLDIASGTLSTIAGTMHLIPTVTVGGAGAFGSPVGLTEVVSGSRIGGSMNTFASVLQIASGVARTQSGMLQTKGSYTRRDEENKFQIQQAQQEIEQLNIQITTAEIRKQMAEKDLRDHESRTDQAKIELEFMKSKFSNASLYNWMLTQVSNTYFQVYQFAHDMARKAESCYRFELGIQDTSFIEYGYWDNLRKGLLAGDKLAQSLRRMEASYMDQNKRELEITRHISLAQYFPVEFMKLKTTGICNLNLQEWFFDLDYPGHYKRRIKSVSVTAPCVTGSYTPINCKLSLSSSTIRSSKERADDSNTYREYAAQQQIVTSNAQADPGMFQSGTGDDRFLPFEGAGAISNWEIQLPLDTNQFDFATLSDFIIHIQYTSLEGDAAAREAAIEDVEASLPEFSVLLLNLRQMFGAEWYKNLAPENTGSNQMSLNISNELFPFFFRNRELKFLNLDLYVEGGTDNPEVNITMETPEGIAPLTGNWIEIEDGFGTLSHYTFDNPDTSGNIGLPGNDHKGIWKLRILSPNNLPLNANELKNTYLVVHFRKN